MIVAKGHPLGYYYEENHPRFQIGFAYDTLMTRFQNHLKIYYEDDLDALFDRISMF